MDYVLCVMYRLEYFIAILHVMDNDAMFFYYVSLITRVPLKPLTPFINEFQRPFSDIFQHPYV